ncbi:MAG: hypothetical protein ACOC8P_03535, partial [Dichotomicrobium sp.]
KRVLTGNGRERVRHPDVIRRNGPSCALSRKTAGGVDNRREVGSKSSNNDASGLVVKITSEVFFQKLY